MQRNAYVGTPDWLDCDIVPGELENISTKEVEEDVQKCITNGDQNSMLGISSGFLGFSLQFPCHWQAYIYT